MTCPHCDGPVRQARFLAYCEKNGQPVFPCSRCRTLNHSLARYCRNCGRDIDFSAHPVKIEDLSLPDALEPARIGSFYQEAAETDLYEDVKSYGGFIWAVTQQGTIHRISPGSSSMEEWDKLSGNGFLMPFALGANPEREPLLYVCNRRTVYQYKLVTKESHLLYDTGVDEREEICSGIATIGSNIYFLARRRGELILHCAGQSRWERALGPLDLIESLHSPLFEVDGSIWVLTAQKAIVFPAGSSAAQVVEESWNAFRVLPTRKVVWYTERQEVRGQSLWRLSFEEHGISRNQVEDIPLSAKFEVDQNTGRIALFLPDSISVYSPTMNLLWETRGNVDNKNPRAILLSSEPLLLVWFDDKNQAVYRWRIGGPDIRTLWRAQDGVSFSRFHLSYGSLLGIGGGKVWRWDLLDN